MEVDSLLSRINNFERKSWAIKRYVSERWGVDTPCPLRFVVNPYSGCSIKCSYCYVWFDKKQSSCKPGFRKALIHDIERAKKFKINNFVVEVSSSTDPFQKLEEDHGDSLFTIDKLLEAGFKVVIVTKNPGMLLNKQYIHLLKNKKVYIDVTITTLENRSISGKLIKTEELTTEKKISFVKEIIKNGKDVRVRIDPLIPTISGVVGQSGKSISKLITTLANIGVKLVISKTLRLNAGLPDYSLQMLTDYYKKNGELVGENYILNKDLRKKLLEPIYLNCQNSGIKFCPCCDEDICFSNETHKCYVADEVKYDIKKCTGGRVV